MRKVAISFFMSVSPSVRPSAWNNSAPGSSEISFLSISLKSVEKIQLSLTSDKNKGTLHENQYTFMIISRLMLLRNVSDKIKGHILYSTNFSRKSCRL
jgi:hypothetical protein